MSQYRVSVAPDSEIVFNLDVENTSNRNRQRVCVIAAAKNGQTSEFHDWLKKAGQSGQKFILTIQETNDLVTDVHIIHGRPLS